MPEKEYIEREARYIDANKFIERLDIGHLRLPSEKCLSELNVKKMIELQPTADVAEVKHGEWVQISKDWRSTGNKCSVCGFKHYKYHTSTNYRFCPNCGAKMHGKENG